LSSDYVPLAPIAKRLDGGITSAMVNLPVAATVEGNQPVSGCNPDLGATSASQEVRSLSFLFDL
jgi:hypothetical protein